jgi:two-component system nitrate/nitrite response regulator NarL
VPNPPQAPVGVLIASQNPAYAAGLADFLAQSPLEPSVVYTIHSAVAKAREVRPALVIIDRCLADGPGAELAAEVRRELPGAKILLASESARSQSQVEALTAGASGCILPTWTREAVLDAARDALRGVSRFDLDVVRSLADMARRRGEPDIELTDQERVVLRLMRQHLTYKEIAQRLGLSWHTVRTHAQSILRKHGVHSRRDLDAWDARAGEPAPMPAAR